VRRSSGSFERLKASAKLQRAGALHDAAASFDANIHLADFGLS
jgi:hypothetical protein